MNKKPLVSVIMPVYNGSIFMAKAIESILHQTYAHIEFLIVDDGSTDDTAKILKRYKKASPKKIRLFRMKKNSGAFAATNFAFSHAKGTYIALMDSDDISHRRRIEKEVAFLEIHPDVILVGTNARIIDGKGRIIGKKHYPSDHENLYKIFAWVNPIVHPSAMIRRSLLPTVPYLYHTNFGVNSDYYTFFEWLNLGKFANLPDDLFSYRIHGTNSSLQNLKEKFYTITKIRLEAVTKLHYRAPAWLFPAMAVQMLVVLLLPEAVLRELFFYVRGIKEPRLRLPGFFINLKHTTIKRYALSAR